MTVVLQVVDAGVMSAVQDRGRFGWEHMGVARGGALDDLAYLWVNRLAGNSTGAAVVESVLQAIEVVPSDDVWMATAGAGEVVVGGRRFPGWAGFWVRAGSPVRMGAFAGARAYLAASGGIDVNPVLGSRSTDLVGGFGGFRGRALRHGDELPLGPPPRGGLPRQELWRSPSPIVLPQPAAVRAVKGPSEGRWADEVLGRLEEIVFTVAPQSNQMGLRLRSDQYEGVAAPEGISQPMPVGAIQTTPSGELVVLLAGRGTVGGYPVLATVVSADLWQLAQLRPGDRVRFELLHYAEAVAAVRQEGQRRDLMRPTRVKLGRR